MLTRFSYTVLMFTRSKSLILWALAFPIILDRYVHGAAQYRLLAKEKPLALLLPSTAEAFFGDTTPIEELPVTHTDLDSMARYFYAVLAMSAG